VHAFAVPAGTKRAVLRLARGTAKVSLAPSLSRRRRRSLTVILTLILAPYPYPYPEPEPDP
jgi:hypothetical protein